MIDVSTITSHPGFLIALILTFFISALVISGIIVYCKYKYEIITWDRKGTLIAENLGDLVVTPFMLFQFAIMTLFFRKIKLRVKKRTKYKQNEFYPQFKLGFFPIWYNIRVLQYGGLDDHIVTVYYDKEEDAIQYCLNVSKHGAFAHKYLKIFEFTSKDGLFPKGITVNLGDRDDTL